MKPYGISAHELSRKTGIPGEHLNQAVNAVKPVSVVMALRLSRLFGASPALWLTKTSSFYETKTQSLH